MGLINDHLHSLMASITGAAASTLAPVGDIISKIIIGTTTGVLVWIITKVIAVILRKIKEKKCSKE